jgi:hypothetical protein
MPPDYGIKVIFDGKVAHFVAEIIHFVSFGGVNIGKVIKVEAFLEQHFLVHRGFFFRNKLIEDTPVFLEFGVNIPDVVGHLPVFAVVETVAALVGTEFFINPPNNRLVTFGTGFWHDI